MYCGSCQLPMKRDADKRLCYVCGTVVHVGCSSDDGCERCTGRALEPLPAFQETKAERIRPEACETEIVLTYNDVSRRMVSDVFPILPPSEDEDSARPTDYA